MTVAFSLVLQKLEQARSFSSSYCKRTAYSGNDSQERYMIFPQHIIAAYPAPIRSERSSTLPSVPPIRAAGNLIGVASRVGILEELHSRTSGRHIIGSFYS